MKNAVNGNVAYDIASAPSEVQIDEAILNIHNCGSIYKIEYTPPKLPYRALIRFIDIFCSIIATIILSPFMLIISLIIKINSKGPAIYKQERLGLNGKPFMIYKFRSMFVDAEKNGAEWAKPDDERVTKTGKILRKIRLDELPQLFNIFGGSMTIVGPRPERKVFSDEFEKAMPGFNQRLLVKPGLTGWAQVNGGYYLTADEKIHYDLYYIENQSLWLNIKCILKTVVVIFKRDGAH